MSVRKLLVVPIGIAMAASTLAVLGSAPAVAEPTFVPDANDIVGVGSDTTMNVMHFIAEGVTVDGVDYPGYNELFAPNPADAQLASFDAFGERVGDDCPEVPVANRPAHPVAGEVVPCLTLRAGTPKLWRPNGSGNGKRALYQAMGGPGADPDDKADDVTVGGSNGNPAVNFARSSAPITGSAEQAANIWAFPFALDGFKPGVSTKATNAPAVISAQDFLKIYKGEITNWSQLGGKPGVIKPLVPQQGSGTFQVFNTNMTTLNGGDAEWNKNPNAGIAQEHDPTLVQDDPNAIAPFSTGRAKAFPQLVTILTGGWSVDRALFNVVRNADLDAQFVDDLFGEDGFLCSAAAQPLIEAGGFEQLAPTSLGGICGEATQGTPDNFTTSPDRSTTTTLAAVSQAAGSVRLTARVNETGTPVEGSVTFADATTGSTVGTAAVAARQAVLELSNLTPGARRFTATFTPDDEAFGPSTSEVIEVVVKAASSLAVKAKPVAKGKPGKIVVTLTPGNGSGTVTLLKGSKELRNGSLTGGKATLTTPKLKKTTTFTVVFSGNSSLAGSSAPVKVKVKKKK